MSGGTRHIIKKTKTLASLGLIIFLGEYLAFYEGYQSCLKIHSKLGGPNCTGMDNRIRGNIPFDCCAIPYPAVFADPHLEVDRHPHAD